MIPNRSRTLRVVNPVAGLPRNRRVVSTGFNSMRGVYALPTVRPLAAPVSLTLTGMSSPAHCPPRVSREHPALPMSDTHGMLADVVA